MFDYKLLQFSSPLLHLPATLCYGQPLQKFNKGKGFAEWQIWASKDRRCIFRSFTCDDYYACGYKSDELASYDTVCGMYSQLFSVNDVLY